MLLEGHSAVLSISSLSCVIRIVKTTITIKYLRIVVGIKQNLDVNST